jgi:ribosomal protein S18 acetylase RimI-like enzyme
MRPDHALPHEIEPAFNLLLGHMRKHEREYRVARAVEFIRTGRMDSRGVFVLRDAAGLAGVIVCEPVAGAGGILWPPVIVEEGQPQLEDILVSRACDWLQQQGARLAQCLLSPEDVSLGAPLLRNGFSRVTTLSYLSQEKSPPRDSSPPSSLRFEPYDSSNPQVFHDTLKLTYEATLDCPEVNGVRTVEEVIDGHRAQGEFDPGLWWLAREGGKPVGVLMLIATHPGEAWEVAYMGVVAEERHRGFGAGLLHHARALAHAAGVPRITLCVDDRNGPASRLYRRMGFERYDSRAVFLQVWKRAS